MIMSSAVRITRVFVFLLLCLASVSCVNTSAVRKIHFGIEHHDGAARIHFVGKGAAAGAMMSSSMGPMGIAIGVAIDEGIAKEIDAALVRANCKVDEVVESSFLAVSHSYGMTAERVSSENAAVVLGIDRVGFKVLPSERDLTFSEVSISLTLRDETKKLTSRHTSDEQGIPLEQIRRDGKVACELLQESVMALFDEWYRAK
jgi:hypothetical protein